MKKKYFISVGEPWNFESPDGQNVIHGDVVKVLNANCLLFKANYILDFNGISSNLFVLYPRHAESDFEDLKNGIDYVTINGNILFNEYNESLDEDYLKENSKFVIIGSIRV